MRPVVRPLAIAAGCALFLLPIVFMVSGSLRLPGLPPPDGFEWFPSMTTRANYRTVVGLVPLLAYMRNSLVVVLIAVPVTVVVASWAGFAIVIATPRARRALIVVSLVALMVPISALWVPRFVMFRWMGLVDTIWPLIAPALMATTPFYVLVFALAYSRIPRSLYEAAALEGWSPLQIWRHVAFPLGRPAAFAIAVLAFVWHWSNFIDPLLFLSSQERFTVPLGLRALQTLEPTNHPLLLAGAVIVTIPPVLAFFAAQRAFFTKTLEV